jgi:8-oxo-dGTP diphosphatase
MTATDVVVAAAWVHVRDRRVLTVRAGDSDAFYLPGGKPEPGESDAEAAAREVLEEVGLTVDPAALRPFVTIDAPAHGRPPGTRVRLVCFTGPADGTPVASAEITELGWFTSSDAYRCAPAIRLLLTELIKANLID